MPVNPYFNNGKGFGFNTEQNIVRDLVDQAIQIKGIDVAYIPRKLANLDNILGEDQASYFDNAFTIEAYFESIDKFSGKGDFISQFGLQIEDTCTLLVSKRRFKELIGKYDQTLAPRPTEGDLIFLPFVNSSLLEIRYVDDGNAFYQLNDYYTYKLTCTSFQYAHENITTGVPDADNPIPYPLDKLYYSILMENGQPLLSEQSGEFVLESYDVDLQDPATFNNDFQTEFTSIVDYSETNTFGFR